MPKKKSTIINICLLAFLIIVTFLLIFKDYSFLDTINIMIKAKSRYILLAIIMMLLAIVFESINVKSILKSLDKKVSLLKTIKYTFIGFFFSGVTPGGSGGQPVEIYYMKKDNIPITASTLSLLLQLCSYHIITIILGIISLFINPQLVTTKFICIFVIGFILKTLTLSMMLIGLFSKKISKLLVNVMIKILTFFKYSKTDEVSNNLRNSLTTYNQGSKFIREHKMIIIKSLCIVFVQVLFNYSVTYFVYKSFGLSEYSYLDIITSQALLLVATSSIPLPGAVGISENAFLTIYEKIFTMQYLPSALLLSRGITFYLFMFISLIIVTINAVYLKKKSKDLQYN